MSTEKPSYIQRLEEMVEVFTYLARLSHTNPNKKSKNQSKRRVSTPADHHLKKIMKKIKKPKSN